jgi:hypothetical protein
MRAVWFMPVDPISPEMKKAGALPFSRFLREGGAFGGRRPDTAYT